MEMDLRAMIEFLVAELRATFTGEGYTKKALDSFAHQVMAILQETAPNVSPDERSGTA